MRCYKCNTMNKSEANYCLKCGEVLVNELRCDECHELLTIKHRFCDKCGKPNQFYVDPLIKKQEPKPGFFDLSVRPSIAKMGYIVLGLFIFGILMSLIATLATL